jgi:hypothetical protein
MSYDAVGFLFTPSSSTDVYVGSPVDATLRNGILPTGGLEEVDDIGYPPDGLFLRNGIVFSGGIEEIDDIGYPPKTSGLGVGIVAPRRIWF